MAEQIDVVNFLALRSAASMSPELSRWRYIRDCEYIPEIRTPIDPKVGPKPPPARRATHGIEDVDLFSPTSLSPIGRRLAQLIFEARAEPADIVREIENQLVDGLIYELGAERRLQLDPVIVALSTIGPIDDDRAAKIRYAGSRLTYMRDQVLYILPASLQDLPLPLKALLGSIQPILAKAAAPGQQLDENWLPSLIWALRNAADVPESGSLLDVVLQPNGRYADDFLSTKRVLFDVLYGLYILRRRERVDLEPVQDALALLHMLERLGIADFLMRSVQAGRLQPGYEAVPAVLHPDLRGIDFTMGEARERIAALGLFGPSGPEELAKGLAAEPVIHPIIARLRGSFAPFNTLQPIGLGDLKVVKQTFLGYRKSGIAHIETVLDGETKTRTHRNLSRAEDTYTLDTSSESETTKDLQSTNRFELKTEVEDIIKTDIGVTANTSFTYKGNPVIDASIAAGLSVNTGRSATERSSRNFVDEVISKAVSRIQSKVASQRTQTRISESEETNVHSFANIGGNGHISGSYLWLDKVYRGQIYNYGKRMMFEFVLPEPAQFYVEARLQTYVEELGLPDYPMPGDDIETTKMPISDPGEITEAEFEKLSASFDLTQFAPYPPAIIENVQIKPVGGDGFFRKQSEYDLTKPVLTESFSADLGSPVDVDGYVLRSIHLDGEADFVNRNEWQADYQNTLNLWINQVMLFHRIDETRMHWGDINALGTPVANVATPQLAYHSVPSGMLLRNITVKIETKTCKTHTLTITASLSRTPQKLATWQRAVYNEIARKVDQQNNGTASADLDARRTAYRKTLEELKKGKSINEIIQGRSESWNDQQIRRELKRQCVAVVAKEFDEDASQDLLPQMGGMGQRPIDVAFPSLNIQPGSAPDGVVREASAAFADRNPQPITFSAMRLDEAAERGRLVQFLEQAFDWQHLSYLFYPYFWARMPMWLQLMNRDDPADPLFTEFLQAGSARVLLAVKPGYENAVLHFLATREPWLGGASPVIGDPLYLPLYEEVRDRQDDLAGAEPVGDSWEFTLPTSLVYLQSTAYPLPMEYPASEDS